MRRILLLVAFVFALAVPSFAQHKVHDKQKHEQMMKEINDFRLKFLAQEMDLKGDQQKQFFDLYNNMMEERKAVFSEMRALEEKVRNDKNASDEDYMALNEAMTSSKEKMALIEKKYDAKFATFLSPKQILKMKEAEEKFRQKMHEMRGKKKPKQHEKK